MLIVFNSMVMTKFNIGCRFRNNNIEELPNDINVEELFNIDLNERIEDMRNRLPALIKCDMRYQHDMRYVMYLGSLFDDDITLHVLIQMTPMDDDMRFDVIAIEHSRLSYVAPLRLYDDRECDSDSILTLTQHIYYADTIYNKATYGNFTVITTTRKIEIKWFNEDGEHTLFEYDFKTEEFKQIYRPTNMDERNLKIANALLISMFNQNRYVIAKNENDEYELLKI